MAKPSKVKRHLGDPPTSNRFGFSFTLNVVVERPACRHQEGRRAEQQSLVALGWLASQLFHFPICVSASLALNWKVNVISHTEQCLSLQRNSFLWEVSTWRTLVKSAPINSSILLREEVGGGLFCFFENELEEESHLLSNVMQAFFFYWLPEMWSLEREEWFRWKFP